MGETCHPAKYKKMKPKSEQMEMEEGEGVAVFKSD